MYQYYNQYKLMRRRTVNNRLLKGIIIVDTEFCSFYNELIETIEHIYLYCDNVNHLWNDTSMWVRNIYNHHFMISDHEKICVCSTSNQVTHLIITSVKEVIYQKWKQGKEMMISDVQKCLLKNLSILKAKDTIADKIEVFENNWDSFIPDLRSNIHTGNSWYIIWPPWPTALTICMYLSLFLISYICKIVT